ncbi:MAG: hypothetical protein Q9219_002469 [cf. Caloplaca sp. 3 TL-2023]
MSQPQQQYPSRAYSPLQSSPSPLNGPYGSAPPNKRQRLSPNPQSPYNSPSMANIALPNQVYSASYPGPRPYGQPTHPTYNTFNPQPVNQHQYQPPPPQQPQQVGNMGPPSKPVEKDRPTDMNELSDVLLGSGVDLKAEEAALMSRYSPDNSHVGNSFGSAQLGSASNPAHNSFNVYSQKVPGGRDSFYGAGALNQPAVPHQSAEEMAEAAKKQGLRRKAEMDQYHLSNPFLSTSTLHRKLSSKARNERVQIPQGGLYHAQGKQEVQQIVFGPDKHERLVTLKGEDLLNHDAPLVDILTLISLATEERLHSIIEDAAALAVERRRGSNGVVPPEFLDIAAVNGAVEAATGLPTPGNSAVSPKANPLKRSYSDANQPSTPLTNGDHPPSKPSDPHPNPLTAGLRDSFLAERKAEEARLAKRRRKEAAADNADSNGPSSGTATPGLLGDKAPDIDLKKMPTKKELKKISENRISDAQQLVATSNSLSMALGGKVPSWMTSAAKPTNPMLPKANAAGAGASQSTKGGGKGAAGAGSGLPRARVFDFREDGAKGVGIQLRDLVFVLDGERKERRALAKAFARFKDG